MEWYNCNYLGLLEFILVSQLASVCHHPVKLHCAALLYGAFRMLRTTFSSDQSCSVADFLRSFAKFELGRTFRQSFLSMHNDSRSFQTPFST